MRCIVQPIALARDVATATSRADVAYVPTLAVELVETLAPDRHFTTHQTRNDRAHTLQTRRR